MSQFMSHFRVINILQICNSRFLPAFLLRFVMFACLSLGAVVSVVPAHVSAAEDPAPNVIVQPVNINKADAATIAKSLVGVGMHRAEAIVAWREANGPFTDIQQLLAVKGIGAKVLAKNSANIVLK